MQTLEAWTSFRDTYGFKLVFGVIITLSIAWSIQRFVQLRHALTRVGFLPGYRYVINPFGILGRLIPFEIPYFNRKPDVHSRARRDAFIKYNSDIISSSILHPTVQVSLMVGDADAAKEITSNRTLYPKPTRDLRAITLFGQNIVSTEGEDWKRHRRIAAPSFNEKNNKLVFEETMRIVNELFMFWSRKHTDGPVHVEDFVDVATRLALMVISSAGFGKRSRWDDDDTPMPGHSITFNRSIGLVTKNFIIRAVFSERLLKLSKRGRETTVGFKEFKDYMTEMIEEGRNAPNQNDDQRADLFTSLLSGAASHDEKGGHIGISDEELMGNTFVFLFAGHETTAHTIGFASVLLAVHQQHQQRLFEELRDLAPQGETLKYADIVRWSSGLAFIYETLRMYPPATGVLKSAAQDTIVTTSSTDGKDTRIQVPIPEGTRIIIDILGIHYNPKYWKDPDAFRPERFLGDYNRDAFLPFSAGPRACLGRRFSEIETLVVLANLILRYKIEPTPLNAEESLEERNARVLKWHQGSFTLRPTKAALTFTPRQ